MQPERPAFNFYDLSAIPQATSERSTAQTTAEFLFQIETHLIQVSTSVEILPGARDIIERIGENWRKKEPYHSMLISEPYESFSKDGVEYVSQILHVETSVDGVPRQSCQTVFFLTLQNALYANQVDVGNLGVGLVVDHEENANTRFIIIARNGEEVKFTEPDESQTEAIKAEFVKAAEKIKDAKLIDALELPAYTYNRLRRAGIQSVNELCGKTEAELLEIPGLGRRSFEGLVGALTRNGFDFFKNR